MKMPNIFRQIFLKKITIFKWQLNAFGVCCVLLGIVVGMYVGISKIVKILGANDTYQTWEFNSTTLSSYTYDANLISGTASNVIAETNKVTNGTFDTDLTGWTGIRAYLINDEFTDTRATGAVNGTSSTPLVAGVGTSTRVVTDTESKLSVGSGVLSFSGGKATPAYGDPAIWYGSISNSAGRVVIFDITPSVTTEGLKIGFTTSSGQAFGASDTIFFDIRNVGTIRTVTTGAVTSATLATYTAATNYKLAMVFRNPGLYYFIKGGIYTNWTLLHFDSVATASTLYPSIQNASNVVVSDYIRIPTSTFTPTPIAYDTFTRSNGAIGTTESTGPDSQSLTGLSWTGSTWTISGNKLVNTPTLGTEIVTDGAIENWTTATNATSWSETLAGTSTINRESSVIHGGTYAARLDIDASNSAANLTQSLTTIPGAWYQSTVYTKASSAITARWYFGSIAYRNITETTSYVQHLRVDRATSTSMLLQLNRSTATSQSIYYDDVSVKPLTLSSLFATVQTSTADVMASADATVTEYSSAGLVMNLDSATTPQNFVVAYHDGSYATLDKATLERVVNPGFEDTPYSPHTGWTETALNGAVWSDETSFTHSGGHALKGVEGSNASGVQAYQDFATIPGNTYNYSFWTAGDGTHGGRYSILDVGASSYIVGITNTDVTAQQYTQISGTFTAPAGCLSVRISVTPPLTLNGSYAYYDDFSVTSTTDTDLIYTNVIKTTATYSAGATIRVTKDGSTYKLFYNNVLMGTGTITDVGIVSNTIHGVFSTYSGNTIDNFSLYARGTNGEYNDIPSDNVTATYETTTKYSGDGSAKLVTTGSNANFTRLITLGDTSTYSIYAYAYTTGSAVTTNDVNLYYNGSTVSTTFASTGTPGWYLLTGIITGVATETDVGVRVKAGKTVYLDSVNVYKQGVPTIYTTTAYSNNQVTSWDSFAATVTTPGSSSIKYQLCTDNGSTCESSNQWQYYNGSSWTVATNTTTNTNTVEQLTEEAMQKLSVTSKKLSVKAVLNISNVTDIPSLEDITVGLTTDVTPPTNGSTPLMNLTETTTCSYNDNCWTGDSTPSFEWEAGSDGETSVRGYCLYLGTDEEANPGTSKGKLGTSPEPLSTSTCQFITSGTSIDLSTSGYMGSVLSNSDTFITAANTYYLNIKAIDQAQNVASESITIRFRYDGTSPTNVSFISTASGNFSNVVDMTFSWPISGSGSASDTMSNILGYQYQINGTDGDWLGTTHSDTLGIDYIPANTSSYTLTSEQDEGSIVSGNNIVYFRTVDNVGNFSTESTYRTGNLSYGGEAPQFAPTDEVTITPASGSDNNFALSWPEATPSIGQSVTHYYYMVNTLPPSTLSTLQSNSSTYFDMGTERSVDATALPNVNKGTNVVRVVSIDDSDPVNYSPSNYISGTFTLDSSNPDNVGDLVASDSSIKAQSRWNVTLTYTAPTYQGAGNLTYQVYRSTDGTSYTLVGTSTGLSYVDNVPTSREYFYKIYTKDGANASSSGTNAVQITPTGRWTTPPEIDTEPQVTNITTKKATITWTTDRTADSKVAFGTTTLVYNDEEPSNSTQSTGHLINLTGLNPNTTYFFVTKWTDEDGNTGTSEEQSFQTLPAPTVKDVSSIYIGLTTTTIKFTSKDASKIKIYYGETGSFGGSQEIYTSTEEATYTVQLSGLKDGTKYYYKINTFDSEYNEYDGTILDFTTLPRPYISNIALQEVKGTAQTTILVTWNTNTSISSIITYYPEGRPEEYINSVNVELESGEHSMIIRGLNPQTHYILIVKGIDSIGNQAVSDSQRFTTSTDSRPPAISDLSIEGQIIPSVSNSTQESTAQLVISWNTDEPSSSQVELGEGSGISYTQRTQMDSNQTYNHVVVISGLTPSKVYHLRAISTDLAGNTGYSIDTVTIAPKATDNALNLVITNLLDIFGFIGR